MEGTNLFGKGADQLPAATDTTAALIELVRLLAKQAARETFELWRAGLTGVTDDALDRRASSDAQAVQNEGTEP